MAWVLYALEVFALVLGVTLAVIGLAVVVGSVMQLADSQERYRR